MKQILESPLIAGTMPQCEVEMDGLFEFLHPKTTCDLVSCEHHFICSKYEGSPKGTILPISQSIFSPLKRYSPSKKNKAKLGFKRNIFKPQIGFIDGVKDEDYFKGVKERFERLSGLQCSYEEIEGYEQFVCEVLELGERVSDIKRDGVIKPQKRVIFYKADWMLVGNGIAHASCGTFWTKGCLGDHPPMELPSGVRHQKGLDGKCVGNQGYFQRRVMYCHRPLCPVCWKAWRKRQIARAKKRFEVFEEGFNQREKKHMKKSHTTLSIPEKDWGLPQKKMQKLAYKYLKRLGIDGGTIIYHSKRKKKDWYYSPHFHPYVYLWNGWFDGEKAKKLEKDTGWVFKNIGKRPLSKSLSYQLAHAGVPFVRGHVLKWFGSMSYRKLHVEKFHGEIEKCPWGHPMDRYVIYMGNGEAPHLPDKDGFSVLLPKDGWMYLPKGGKKGRNKGYYDEEYF